MKELIIKKQNKPVKSSQVNRIPMISKRRLLNKVFFENKRIKKAAKELGMNYQSAKSILFCYRKKRKLELRSKIKNCTKHAITTNLNGFEKQNDHC